MKKDCGCSKKTEHKGEFLLVPATASAPSTCGIPTSATGGTADCLNQDRTYDSIQSGFLVPVVGQSIPTQVCNPNVYTVGQWVNFLSPNLVMQIIAINGNNLTLRNACEDGTAIDGNPTPAAEVPLGSQFNITGQPPCKTPAELDQDFEDRVNALTSICTEDLVETGGTELTQVVGQVRNDPSDSAFKKCIKRLKGFMYDAGTPILNYITTVAATQELSYRPLVINKSTQRVLQRKNYAEDVNIDGRQFFLAVTSASERPVGPGYVCYPIFTPVVIYKNPVFDARLADHTTWPLMGVSPINLDFNLATNVSGLVIAQDHYIAEVRLHARHSRIDLVKYSINGNHLLTHEAFDDSDRSRSQYSIATGYAKVLKSDNKLTLNIVPTDGSYYDVLLELVAIHL